MVVAVCVRYLVVTLLCNRPLFCEHALVTSTFQPKMYQMFFGSRAPPGPVGEPEPIRDSLAEGGGTNEERHRSTEKEERRKDGGKGMKGREREAVYPLEAFRSRRSWCSILYIHVNSSIDTSLIRDTYCGPEILFQDLCRHEIRG